jgi:hypothetical protein
MATLIKKTGKIHRILENGFIYIRSINDNDNKLFIANFSAINGYKGETARELGLSIGRELEFGFIENGNTSKVTAIKLK